MRNGGAAHKLNSAADFRKGAESVAITRFMVHGSKVRDSMIMDSSTQGKRR